jgi:hypothetical protein
MLYTAQFLVRCLVHQDQFDRWVNVLADNDNLAPAGANLEDETIPAVSLLFFY